MPNIKVLAKKIDSSAKEIKKYKEKKKKLHAAIDSLKERYPNEKVYKKKLDGFLQGRKVKEWDAYFDSHINQSLKEIETKTDGILNQLGAATKETPPKRKVLKEKTATPEELQEPMFYLNKKEGERYKKELKIDEEYLEKLRPEKEGEKELRSLKEYTVYEVNSYGKIANSFVEKYTEKVIKSTPKMYDNLVHALRTSNAKILSKTYVSMMLFTSIIIVFVIILLALLISLFGAEITAFSIAKIIFQSLILSVFAGVATMAAFYYYPISKANTRRRQIKNDLPFVIIHMSAVAGSGAQPISMFNLLLSSGEYKGLEGEIKKIINYVNLFGYDLSTALRTVALTTPSRDFREVLTGLVTTVETGGSLKSYLTTKAEDAMVNYKLERKKYIESLSTYSDMYTGILIAAPLLFFVTLAIIQMMGGAIMGLSAKTIAVIGTYVALPLLNLGFIMFLNLTQPG